MKTAEPAKFRALGAFFSLFSIILITLFSKTISQSTLKAVELCQNIIIPSMLPVFVFNGIFIRLSQRKASKFEGIFPIIIGVVCGCPAGIKTAVSLYESGKISKRNAEFLCLLSSPMSFSFIVGNLGNDFLCSSKRGWAILIIQFFSLVLSSLILRLFSKENDTFIAENTFKTEKASVFLPSLYDALKTVGIICTCVIFFSCLSGMICSVPFLSLKVKIMCSSLLEVTYGTYMIAQSFIPDTAFILISSLISFTGISVIIQCDSVIKGKISLNNFVYGKLIACLISLFLSCICIKSGIV